MTVDLMTQPVGKGKDGKDVYLGDIWPTSKEIGKLMKFAMNSKVFKSNYADVKGNPASCGNTCLRPKATSTTGRPRPTSPSRRSFDGFEMVPKAAATGITGARALGVFGDSITTDHISPAGSIKERRSGGQMAAGQRRDEGRLQLLRLAPRQPRDHDARHLRQRAHQEQDDPCQGGRFGGRRRHHDSPAKRRTAVDLRRGDEVRRGRHLRPWCSAAKSTAPARRARLGRQGHPAAGREGRDRALVRTHPPLQPGRHGRAAAAVHRATTASNRWASPARKSTT